MQEPEKDNPFRPFVLRVSSVSCQFAYFPLSYQFTVSFISATPPFQLAMGLCMSNCQGICRWGGVAAAAVMKRMWAEGKGVAGAGKKRH